MTDPWEVGFLSTIKLKRFHLAPDVEGSCETCVHVCHGNGFPAFTVSFGRTHEVPALVRSKSQEGGAD